MKSNEQVLIISKTKVNREQDCIGAISLDTNRYLRLFLENEKPIPNSFLFEIGQIWNMTFKSRSLLLPPHNEDVIICDYNFTKKHINNLYDFLTKELNIPIWKGSIDKIFDSQLKWTNGGIGYITEESLPTQSVGFWIPDTKLSITKNKHIWYYLADKNQNKFIRYAGYQAPVKILSNNNLLRLSLTRWLKTSIEKNKYCCYLQLSGWYN